ncbi:MAG TPA: hypothetical protein VJ946_08315 [Bacteroidales bacterium]|nr:hypothetical protein [Bacteroidales bacterium]
MKRLSIIGILFLLISSSGFAQKKFTVDGYVKFMQTATFQDIDSLWITDNLIHNRFNLAYYPNDWLNAHISVRNRMFYGEMVTFSQPPFNALLGGAAWDYMGETDKDRGLIDMSWNYLESDSYFFNTSIDRAYINIQHGNWDITAGRHRINWGQTMVWNPNDLFNAYSYFDFDYEEKPGSDAVRAQYYLDFASRIEFAAAVNRDTNYTAALLYQFNKFQYDIQILAGVYQSEDVVAGLGWSGNLWNAGFRGEISYFRPTEHFSDSSGVLAASVGADYSFPNSLFIQAEVLFNSSASKDYDFNLAQYYNQSINAKNLSLTRWTGFTAVSYPITPLINLGFSAMYSPQDNFTYLGPSATFSLSQDFTVDLNIQSFFSDIPDDGGGKGTYAFLRGKWSF